MNDILVIVFMQTSKLSYKMKVNNKKPMFYAV